MRLFFCLVVCCFSSFSLFAGTLSLKEQLKQAEPGNYVVTVQDKTFTFFHIYDTKENHLLIEEVTLPAARYPKQKKLNWKGWFEQGAPGHTSWTMTQINLHKGVLEESFSFTKQGWFDTKEANRFMATLLSLPFNELPSKERRRVGLAPGYNRQDKRPLWNPPLIVEGRRISNPTYHVYKARWPRDRSELSKKIIEVYLPDVSLGAPTFFPFWLEVEGKIGSAKMRVIDSGKGATSPKPPLPYRSPKFMGGPLLDEAGITLHVESPPYLTEFTLVAEEAHALLGKTFLLPYQITHEEGQHYALHIPRIELEKQMLEGEEYHFLLTAKEYPKAYALTEIPLKYRSL